jgi:circadian clock protein KaiC
MSGIERAPSGIPGFDTIAHGGLPRGRATILAGMPGSGKTLFGLSFLRGGVADEGEAGIYVTFEERPKEVLRNAESFGWGLDQMIADRKLTLLDASFQDTELRIGAFDLDGVIARIEHIAAETGARRLVVDSLSAILARFTSVGDARAWMLALVTGIRDLGLTALLLIERRDEGDHLRVTSVESVVADAVILLRNSLDGSVRRRTLEVVKLRGGSHERGAFPSAISAGSGFEVIPLAATKLERQASNERSSFGHEVIDAMTCGGLLKNTITLVRGPSGVGKSLLTATFLKAGIDAGEQVLMFSFEESPAEIVRNAASVGLDLRDGHADGRLRIAARYPERLTLEDLLAQLKSDIERYKPTRIGLDSLSALSRSASPGSARDFVVAFTTYLKEQEIAGLMTEQCDAAVGIGGLAHDSFAASLADAVMLLRFDLEANRVTRSLTVVKQRGSAHATDVRPFRITSSGLELSESS